MTAATRAKARFWARVDQSAGPDGCWLWTGATDKDGYGRFQVGERHQRAHRLVLEEKLGRRLTRSEQSLHHCDNPPCVNPAHLFLGTQADNVRDMVAKGRWCILAPAAKLSGSEVLEICRAVDVPSRTLADRFGIHISNVRKIRRGLTYRQFSLPTPAHARRAS